MLFLRSCAWLLLLAFTLDLLLGDPEYPFHPVRLIGHTIEIFKRIISRLRLNDLISGLLILLFVEAVFIGLYLGLSNLTGRVSGYLLFIFNSAILYSLLAFRDMLDHVKRIIVPLDKEYISHAREMLSLIVGRDVTGLDKHGISRATIESMSENFVDGLLSPVFWFVLGVFIAPLIHLLPPQGGIVSVIFFKVTSTIDSMMGYKSREYFYLGKAGARLDDILNFIPARLSILILFLGALILRLSPLDGLKISLRDRLKHESPNSAHAESFMAGALNISLGGPQVYPHGIKERPYIGSGTLNVNTTHIKKGMKLILCSGIISITLSCLFLGRP